VVSGIGFLGAGAILRFGFNIKGLTTASTLWTMAIIGMVIGHGDYWIGIIATVLILIVLGLLDTFEHRFIRASRICEIVVDVEDINRTVHEVREVINASVQRKLSYSTRKSIRHKHLRMEVVAQIAGDAKVEDLVDKISGIEGVRAVKVE
jgi:putative Mg2+ transporter-C (MgtC) family protein